MKYIDAEILYREVDRLMAHYATAEKEMEDDVELSIFYQGKRKMCSEIIDHITSLQQEQPECIYGRTFKEREKYCKFCSAVCEVRVEQEQPEVDLEKFTEKIKTFQGRYKHPESISIKGAMAFMARMFYQYPNVARQWYDNLPKATMD